MIVSVFVVFETESHYVAQAGLKLGDPSASTSWMLGLQVCTTMVGYPVFLIYKMLCVLGASSSCLQS
jgi:hypothetical protein